MTLTRTQAGKTPKKTEFPNFVETPGARRRSSRKFELQGTRSDDSDAQTSTGPEDNVAQAMKRTPRRKSTRIAEAKENGSANGHVKAPKLADGWMKGNDTKIDHSGHFEFGGSLGVSAIMIGFPLLMYYMWIGATYYDGRFPRPEKGQTYQEFFRHLYELAYAGAYPHAKAWIMYWGMFAFELVLYYQAPGIWAKGKPLPHENGRQLDYYCSALWSWWITIFTAIGLHASGVFKLYTIMDEFGPLMTVAIISGIACSIVAYVSAWARGAQHRMTGYPVYDFFMGSELNPRLFGIIDFKMFFEVRLPWFILFLLTLGACARQYEQYGYVSGELGFLLMAHFLYTNACAKAEQLIISTWDMYYEKLGFMLTFWNMAGVPLSYCHCTIYLANHDPKTYAWNKYALGALYVTYLFVYWVWDTTNSQKNSFRAQEKGVLIDRKAFPQLPWKVVKNPRVIRGEGGITILADGMYRYARKIHYTCDLFFALSWGAVTGFNSPFPWFYPTFFTGMIIHRAARDIQRCRERYGDAWLQYEKEVPYLFIPYII